MTDQLGPTGKFPDGKLIEEDQGEIALALDIRDGRVEIIFENPVNWIAMTPDQAVDFAAKLIEKAHEALRRDC